MGALGKLTEALEPPEKSSSRVLGKPATMEEVWRGMARACWTCCNSECSLSKQDVLMKCTSHIKHDEAKLAGEEFKKKFEGKEDKNA